MDRKRRFLLVLCLLNVSFAVLLPAHSQYNCSNVSESSNTALNGVVVASGLSLATFVSAPPGDTNRIFILEKAGRIRIHKHGQPASTLQTFLDITSRVNSSFSEMGLLGLAFDPSYATTGYFWVDYTEVVSTQIYTVIARYTVTAGNPDTADFASEQRVLRIAQPDNNHKGGMLMFGADGFLYIGMGDGGGTGDGHGTCGNGQNRSVLLGKLLRIDVRGVDPAATAPDCGLPGANYTVPKSNPFNDGAGTGFCDEIWAYGLRNPWRPSFDALNNELYIADVGQNCTEEIDWARAGDAGGKNYGWRQMEGLQCFDINNPNVCNPLGQICAGSPPCNDPSITLPVLQYSHTGGACAITGGYVYRGCRMPNYRGRYFYGDYCLGRVDSFVLSSGVPTLPMTVTSQVDPGGTLFGDLSSFGTDGQGELYAVALNGSVRKFVPPFTDLEVSGAKANAFRLSKAGDWTWEDLFVSTDVPVSYYRVYRGSVAGAYTCVFKALTPSWPAGGDPAVPVPGQLFAYVVAAVDGTGAESKRGTVGTFNAATCP